MKKIIYTFLAISTIFILVSSAPKTTGTCDSPIVGDHSGAPGETTCSGCHSAPVNPDLPELILETDSNDSTYIPGHSYVVHIFIKKPGHNKFGFVCSSLDSLNNSKGTFNLINTITTRKYAMGGRNYISHTPCGADVTDSADWTFNWVAPAFDSGKIKIFMSMLVANHNHALTGDTTYTRVISLSPKDATGAEIITQKSPTRVYPTCFTDNINIEFNHQFDNSFKEISLMNLQGKVLKQISTVKPGISIQVNEPLPKGIYLLKINYGKSLETIKIVKQ